MNIIEVKNLTKKYGKFTAVDNISFDVESGTIFGLLGPNGAGKTTTIECMIGLKKPDGGELRILDMDALKAGKKLFDFIGVQLQETSYQDKLRVWELCDLFSAMYENPLSYMELLEKFSLTEKKKEYISSLSGGQRQKLAIILSLISNPKIVFLDELTTGLDPKARREMWQHVKQLKAEGRTVFLTTHYMEEATHLCDMIGIIDSGQLVALSDVEGVIESAQLKHEVSFLADNNDLDTIAKNLDKDDEVTFEDGVVRVHSAKEDIISDVVLLLKKHNIAYKHLDIKRPSLEDAYLKLTGKQWEA
ncbi:MAG: ABC transporter ATP-binding protein [Eubacteriales bacterium]